MKHYGCRYQNDTHQAGGTSETGIKHHARCSLVCECVHARAYFVSQAFHTTCQDKTDAHTMSLIHGYRRCHPFTYEENTSSIPEPAATSCLSGYDAWCPIPPVRRRSCWAQTRACTCRETRRNQYLSTTSREHKQFVNVHFKALRQTKSVALTSYGTADTWQMNSLNND